MISLAFLPTESRLPTPGLQPSLHLLNLQVLRVDDAAHETWHVQLAVVMETWSVRRVLERNARHVDRVQVVWNHLVHEHH